MTSFRVMRDPPGASHFAKFIPVREHINSLRGDDLRRDTMHAQMDARLGRIDSRLNLNDPQH